MKSGQFFTQKKILGFRTKSGVLHDEALIDMKYLSGLDSDNTILKMKIFGDGSVNFDEVDTNNTSKDQRGRLLEYICDIQTSKNRPDTLDCLKFRSIDGLVDLYISFEFEKPIDKLYRLLGDEPIQKKISPDKLKFLDDLIGEIDTDTKETPEPVNIVESEKSNDFIDYTKEFFDKMMADKVSELNDRIKSKRSEIKSCESLLNDTESNLIKMKSEMAILEDRIDSLSPNMDANGYFFNVSEMVDSSESLPPDVIDMIFKKISSIKSIKAKAFMSLFKDGRYNINICNPDLSEISDYTSISDILPNIDLRIEKDSITYIGDMTWSMVVNKMLKMGFTQNADYDKMCSKNDEKN